MQQRSRAGHNEAQSTTPSAVDCRDRIAAIPMQKNRKAVRRENINHFKRIGPHGIRLLQAWTQLHNLRRMDLLNLWRSLALWFNVKAIRDAVHVPEVFQRGRRCQRGVTKELARNK